MEKTDCRNDCRMEETLIGNAIVVQYIIISKNVPGGKVGFATNFVEFVTKGFKESKTSGGIKDLS
eukprot:scaffold1767_cov64-Attheya_sp.AAC.1